MPIISDTRTTLEAKHKSVVKNLLSHDNVHEKREKMEALRKKLDDATTWEERCDIDSQITRIENELSYEHSDIDYMLSVAPIIQRYTSESSTSGDQRVVSGSFVHTRGTSERGKMYDEYLSITENAPLQTESNCTYTCKACNEPRIMSLAEATMICPTCGDAEINFEMGAHNMSYDQEVNSDVNICFAYKRINHFNEWMAQFQAKESTYIPPDIIDALRVELKKIRISDMTQITQKRVKELLKKLKYNKFYEHVPQITNMLSGISPPTMTPHLEEQLRNMFRDIQEPFEKHKPKGRSNFLSYGYCLYKFCELLGHDEFLDSFPLLKSREKLYQQDCIFRKICDELDWEFIPTV